MQLYVDWYRVRVSDSEAPSGTSPPKNMLRPPARGAGHCNVRPHAKSTCFFSKLKHCVESPVAINNDFLVRCNY